MTDCDKKAHRYNPARMLAVHRRLAAEGEQGVSKAQRNAELAALAAFTAVKRLDPVVTQDRPGRPAHMHRYVGDAV